MEAGSLDDNGGGGFQEPAMPVKELGRFRFLVNRVCFRVSLSRWPMSVGVLLKGGRCGISGIL